MGDRIEDFFDSYDEFDELLEDAEINASRSWETIFVSDIREKFDQYGMDCFLSEKQLEKLEGIANLGDSDEIR